MMPQALLGGVFELYMCTPVAILDEKLTERVAQQ
jgi:hypothetical protein